MIWMGEGEKREGSPTHSKEPRGGEGEMVGRSTVNYVPCQLVSDEAGRGGRDEDGCPTTVRVARRPYHQ